MSKYITRKDLENAVVVEVTVADGVVVHYYTNEDRREVAWQETFSVKTSVAALAAYCNDNNIAVRDRTYGDPPPMRCW